MDVCNFFAERNLLYIAHQDEAAWRTLNATMYRLFACRLEVPQRGQELVCEFRQGTGPDAPVFDVASAGSGFLQVLLLLSLLLTQYSGARTAATVLLIDEPDAHLHMLLQRSIYGELRQLAAQRQSQLIVATHSEMIVNHVDERELYLMYSINGLVDGNLPILTMMKGERVRWYLMSNSNEEDVHGAHWHGHFGGGKRIHSYAINRLNDAPSCD